MSVQGEAGVRPGTVCLSNPANAGLCRESGERLDPAALSPPQGSVPGVRLPGYSACGVQALLTASVIGKRYSASLLLGAVFSPVQGVFWSSSPIHRNSRKDIGWSKRSVDHECSWTRSQSEGLKGGEFLMAAKASGPIFSGLGSGLVGGFSPRGARGGN